MPLPLYPPATASRRSTVILTVLPIRARAESPRYEIRSLAAWPVAALLAFFVAPAHAQPGASAPAPTHASAGEAIVGPPAKNWVLPLFSDQEGFRTMTLRGSEAHSVGTDRIDITDLSITAFSGDAAARVDTILLSPAARFFPEQKRATGEKSVRFLRDEMEVTGERWSFNQVEKRVLIDQNVRVVLHAQLRPILK